jgi:hypothetical protein
MSLRELKRRAGTISANHRGYVLVLCLVLLTLVSLILAGVANTSLVAATDVLQLRESVQRRWGHYSLRQAFLSRAELLITSRSADRHDLDEPLNHLVVPLRLGTTEMTVTLWDESAKLNLNTVHAIGGRGDTSAWLRRQLPRQLGRHLHLRPNEGEVLFCQDSFESWGQVIQWNDAAREDRAREKWDQFCRTTTCWGDGRLNICRASLTAIAGLCEQAGATGAARRLVAFRTLSMPRPLAGDYVKQLTLPDSAEQHLVRWVTDQSSCYSLDIRAADSAGWSARYVAGRHSLRLPW